MKSTLKPGSMTALLIAASLGVPAFAQNSAPQPPPQQTPQVQTGASTNPNAQPQSQTSAQGQGQTATGQAPLPTREHEGFWGHMNPFARKKWVNNQLSPVKGRLNELDEIQAKNEQDIKDVDRRAQNGIHAAQSSADQANQTASQASQTAGRAQQLAQQANDMNNRLGQTVASLDQYHPVNNLEIRFHPGESSLNQSSQQALDQVVNQMQGQKGYIVEVEGYSRVRGVRGVENSQHMAETVVRYLAEHQIPIWRIHEVAMGNAAVNENGEQVAPRSMVRVSLMENSLASLNLSGDTGGSPIGATQSNSAQPSPQGTASQQPVPQP